MKRLTALIFLMMFCLAGCDSSNNGGYLMSTAAGGNSYVFDDTTTAGYGILSAENNAAAEITVDNNTETENQKAENEFRGVWLSYYELNVTDGRDTEESYREYITSLCNTYISFGITDVFAQVRPYGDAVYKSSLFPTSEYAADTQGGELPFDLLSIICQVCASYGIKVHAWINPYRVAADEDISALSQNNIARQWYGDGTDDVSVVSGKIYFNPASERAQNLVIEGAREILLNYPVAGIHIDDYFYPPSCGNFDSFSYKNYTLSGGKLALDDWRRENVNTLVKGLYNCVKSVSADKIFSISPSGNINKNFTELYADTSLWCGGGYADMIIPQLYFGFKHSTHPFDEALSQWLSLKGENVKMVIGLALYKSGQEDAYAGDGKTEWLTDTDIIKRQVELIRKTEADGFCLFSTSDINLTKSFNANQLNNLKTVL